MQLFNRSLHRLRREKSAGRFAEVDFLFREAGERLAERLLDINRHFPLAVELGCRHGVLAKSWRDSGKIGGLIQTDMAPRLLPPRTPSNLLLAVDEEWLPFAPQSLDAIVSTLSLHWVNDLPGCLIQCRNALKADGLFLAVLPGPRSLQELRESILAVSSAEGKMAPRISPFVEVRDAGALLQRAGFALPVIDSETLTIHYREPMTLLNELRLMGEANCLIEQHKGLTARHFWPQVMEHYASHYAAADGRLPVTIELVFMTAWAPHASQQQPAKRGSGTVNLRDVLS